MDVKFPTKLLTHEYCAGSLSHHCVGFQCPYVFQVSMSICVSGFNVHMCLDLSPDLLHYQ